MCTSKTIWGLTCAPPAYFGHIFGNILGIEITALKFNRVVILGRGDGQVVRPNVPGIFFGGMSNKFEIQ